MSTVKQSKTHNKQGRQPKESSHLKVYLCINLNQILMLLERSIKKSLRRLEKVALILLVCQLLDRPAVVVPESLFVIVLEPAPYRMLGLKRQLDEALVSCIDSSLDLIRNNKALICETV